jgi:PAS domain S-box-containing protein
MYFRYIFPKEFSKYMIYLVNFVGGLFSGIVLFTPAKIYTLTAPFFQIFTLAASCYGFYVLILAFKRKQRGALVCLSGFVILFLTIVNDIMYSNLLIQTGYMIQLGFFAFIFSQASLLAFRFSKMFTTVELQHRKLEKEILGRKRTEEALIESEEKYRLVVENANDAVAVAQDGMIRFVNRRGIELSGYSEEELKAQPFIELVHPKDRELVRQNYLSMLSGESVPTRYAFRFIHKDGSIRWIEISVVRITWENSPATLSVLHDITEKRRMEEELFKAQKLESIGILAGGIAHDFNNILAGIMGNISLAKIDINQNANTYHLLDEAEKASERATALTGQLLTFSKGGSPLRRIANISVVIVDCSTFALRGSKVRCDYNFSSDLWPVEIDEGQINQVIQNIIINAGQAMSDGGTIKISAENIIIETNSGLPLQAGRYVKMRFQDQGSGIPEGNINKIFDPFFSTKQTGSGLGLTIAYAIVKRHDGHIVVNSQVGHGTTFYIYLPSSIRKAQKKIKDVPDAITGKGKILAMDDEQTVRDVIYQMLRHMGYDVDLASEGQEAIKLYRRAIEADEPFDAVILDLTVPGAMGGKKTIGRLREIDSNVKAIIASGYSNDPVMSDYKNYGFCGVVVKPFNIQKLARILSDVLKG